MYAYVTLVMRGDEYVEGALVLAKSLTESGTKHDLVCMVTWDVSAAALQRLSRYYKIVQVKYVYYKCPRMLTARQDQLYSKWINYSFTKWQCFSLTQYAKIVYLDADHLVLKNIDHLFDMTTPALCFSSDFHKYYDHLCHGDLIGTREIVSYFRFNKILCKTGTAVLTPNLVTLERIKRLLHPGNCCLVKNRYHNGYDEQVLLQAIVQSNQTITQLSLMYVWSAGNYPRLRKNAEPYIINYYGDKKPWKFSARAVVRDTLADVAKKSSVATVPFMDEYIWKYFAELVRADETSKRQTCRHDSCVD
jgi:Glycosyl transferase family 8